MRRITAAQRRARMAVRHHLARGGRGGADDAVDVVTVAGDLVGLHASDPATVYLAARARVQGFEPADLERALYDDRSLARVLAMRRTMFVAPTALVPVLHAACTRALAARERRRTVKMLQDAGIAHDAAAWLRAVEAATWEALEARGEATAGELSRAVPELREKIPVGQGKKWAGNIGVSTRVLFLLANEGRIVRGRPRGSWTSSQYRWAPLRSWLGVDVDELSSEDARVELARRWLYAFGPATVDDLRWWTGWTVGQTRAALAALPIAEVDLDGVVGVGREDDVGTVAEPASWVALLPALDPTVMGWRHRDWYIGAHTRHLFDRNGNAGPTVWCDGRVVGGWTQRPDGEVVVRLLEDVGVEASERIDEEAARLTDWFGDARIIPRFRTPLDRALSS